MKLRSKLLALAAAGSTAGLFAFTGVTTGAHAVSCGVSSNNNNWVAAGAPVYASGSQVPPSGYAGVQGSGGPASGFAEVGGSTSGGYVSASGTSPAKSGGILITTGGSVTQC